MLGGLRSSLGGLRSWLSRHMLVANTVSGGGLLVLGDLIQQRAEARDQLDKQRSLRMLAVGLSQVRRGPHLGFQS